MPYPIDLLEQASHLARREKNRPKQASLRRAVSTAYYALFHLLTNEAVGLWRIVGQRPTLARAFEHGRMKSAAGRLRSSNAGLQMVAEAFVDLQRARHDADYDNAKIWSRSEALEFVDLAEASFEQWNRIRTTRAAQDFLLSLLIDRR